MGVVYKAEDIRLHRFVAPKFLPDNVAKDPQALPNVQRDENLADAARVFHSSRKAMSGSTRVARRAGT
jgi:hypothetical protein